MKKAILLFAIISFFASCKDDQGLIGKVKKDDEKSKQIQKCVLGMAKHDSAYASEISIDSLRLFRGGKPEGKKEWVKSFSFGDTVNFKSYYIDENSLNIESQYNNNGEIYTYVWANLLASGKYTKTDYTVPVHMSFKWQNSKIEVINQYYDKSFLDKEANASEAFQLDIYNKKFGDIYQNDIYDKDIYKIEVKKPKKEKKK